MLRYLLGTLVVIALSGCVSTKSVPLSAAAIADHQGGTVVVSKREKPAFAAMTAGKAMFGAIGGAAMVTAGNQLIKENDVDDPSAYIAEQLLRDFSQVHALTPVAATGGLAKGTDIAELSRLYGNGNLLLDVQTVNWSFAYFPTDWNSYRVIYSAKLRLIDTSKKKLLAEGFCSRIPENDANAPSREQLLENKAARLKQELHIAADYCIAEFRSKVLSI